MIPELENARRLLKKSRRYSEKGKASEANLFRYLAGGEALRGLNRISSLRDSGMKYKGLGKIVAKLRKIARQCV